MERRIKLLVVDDEAMICEAISSFFEKQGFLVHTAETGEEALRIFVSQKIDFVILDLMLGDLSGEEVCKNIRQKSNVPIIMLTAKTMEEDVLNGLQIGADDYIRKPFSLKELYARVEVILRRISPEDENDRKQWNNGELQIDFQNRTVIRQGESVSLTPSEWRILEAFVHCPQKVFTREELISITFDSDYDGYDRVIDTHVKNLRRKLEKDTKNPVYLLTVHGVGYRFGGDSV